MSLSVAGPMQGAGSAAATTSITATSGDTRNSAAGWITPVWPVPFAAGRVRALMTTRSGGVSAAPFDEFNLGTRCGDDPQSVARNRAALRALLPAEPAWLKQVHGANVVEVRAGTSHAADTTSETAPLPQPEPAPEPDADASVTHTPGAVCAVLVADCMPVLLADRAGTVVAAVHAGWRGLSGGVIEATVRAMHVAPQDLMAWLGPAIGPAQFEVGADVLDAFTREDAGAASAFQPYPGRDGKYLCDLYALARRRLRALGVTAISGGGYCTVSEARFYSFRRDKVTGRMGAFIWIDPLGESLRNTDHRGGGHGHRF